MVKCLEGRENREHLFFVINYWALGIGHWALGIQSVNSQLSTVNCQLSGSISAELAKSMFYYDLRAEKSTTNALHARCFLERCQREEGSLRLRWLTSRSG
ncbi:MULTISPECIES: hypothetical protein [unclassified Microcoleus]|uniref:hypothetical protein n=1 Tax=unclassified Microcoleus TaxID=2642155 RepID=UPI0025FC7DC8|nr:MULTISPECIES: hypothetical protein [unclassified Microcoleus]